MYKFKASSNNNSSPNYYDNNDIESNSNSNDTTQELVTLALKSQNDVNKSDRQPLSPIIKIKEFDIGAMKTEDIDIDIVSLDRILKVNGLSSFWFTFDDPTIQKSYSIFSASENQMPKMQLLSFLLFLTIFYLTTFIIAVSVKNSYNPILFWAVFCFRFLSLLPGWILFVKQQKLHCFERFQTSSTAVVLANVFIVWQAVSNAGIYIMLIHAG